MQGFYRALNISAEALADTRTLTDDSELAQSIGIVCTVNRSSTNRRQKDIKPFALQKTFYAYPKDITQEKKDKIKKKIEADIADFKCQQYNVELHTFGLPFAVDEICCISAGYNLTAKMFRASLPKEEKTPSKRKRGTREESASDDEDTKDDIYHDDNDDEDGDDFKPVKKGKASAQDSCTSSRALRSKITKA